MSLLVLLVLLQLRRHFELYNRVTDPSLQGEAEVTEDISKSKGEEAAYIVATGEETLLLRPVRQPTDDLRSPPSPATAEAPAPSCSL
ncbi:hypothetical protein DFH27DRAFT_614146 [Peziza echinospora]|nr:hypothetical protein DFH27DRAFT_614146 [Peziza echinospora]